MTLPKEQLDNRTFDDIVREAKARIPVYAPGWTDHNVHDPGITFVELFAWLTEMQLYRLDRIDDKHERKYLKILGIPKPRPAIAARAYLRLIPKGTSSVHVPAGTIVHAVEPSSGVPIPFETQEPVDVLSSPVPCILTRTVSANRFEDNTKANDTENIYFYPFGPDPDALCELYLGFEVNLSGKRVEAAFYLSEEPMLKDHEEASAISTEKLFWEYLNGTETWKEIESLKDGTNALMSSGTISFGIAGAMQKGGVDGKELYWLRCRIREAYESPPRLDAVQLNTVLALQRSREFTESVEGTGMPDMRVIVKHLPILDGTMTIQSQDGAVWSEVEDFDASKPGDVHYVVDTATGAITFGSGVKGKIPAKGTGDIMIKYRTGGGTRGNVPASAINMMEADLADEVTVTNAKPAFDGADAEPLEKAFERARSDLRSVTRAVTTDDYEYLAGHTPGLKVARAKALPGYHPSQKRAIPGIVSVIVVPESPKAAPLPGTAFIKSVYRHLYTHRLLGTELFVLPPVYVEVSVTATVVITPLSVTATVKDRVVKRLEQFFHPTRGGKDGKGWPFGRPVYLSELYQVIDEIEGVNFVTSVMLTREGNAQQGDIHIPKHGLVHSGGHRITAVEE